MSRLEWLRGWAQETAAKDADENCRTMAAAVSNLQGSLAAGAMAALSSAPQQVGSGGLLPLPQQGISLALPSAKGIKLP